jgi:hypothetical protein
MTERLRKVLEAIARLQQPSIADILRKRGFRYEADHLVELVEAWNEYILERPVP